MAVRGRKPTPTPLKVLRGNPGKRALNAREPKPRPILGEPPAFLDPEAKRLWEELAPKLERLAVGTEIDAPSFAMACTHYVLAVKAARILKREGLSDRDERGLARKHPMTQVLRDNSAAWLRYAEQFGLTPSARSRLTVPQPDNPDEFEEFLRRGQGQA